MARVDPRNAISDKELVGRRVFGEKYRPFYISPQGTGGFRWGDFVEEPPDELSMDRIGLKKCDPEIFSHLAANCSDHAKSMSKVFSGWAYLDVAQLRAPKNSLSVVAARIPENQYHAELQTAALTQRERNLAAYMMANEAKYAAPPAGQNGAAESFIDEMFRRFREFFGA